MMRACHQSECTLFAALGHWASASRGISHSCQVFLSTAFSLVFLFDVMLTVCFQVAPFLVTSTVCGPSSRS
jgi:hypothetical protein